MSDKNRNAIKTKRKAYNKPELRKHGRISRITTGGSGLSQEMMMSMNMTQFP